MHFADFRTRTYRFPNWKERAYWVAAWVCGGPGLFLVFGWVERFDLQGPVFWIAFGLAGVVFLAVGVVVTIALFLFLNLNVSHFWDGDLRGFTRVDPDGFVVLESTRDGRELARCTAGCKKSIVVGMGRFQQTAKCAQRAENSEPVFASLNCADSRGDGPVWIALFSMAHDRRDVVVSVNEEEIRFPYHGRPDYWKIARRVAQSCPAFADLEVRDASAK